MVTKIIVFNGGTVGRCRECNTNTLRRRVVVTTEAGGSAWDDVAHLCDTCADVEVGVARVTGAKIIDGRKATLSAIDPEDARPSPHANLFSAAEARAFVGRRYRDKDGSTGQVVGASENTMFPGGYWVTTCSDGVEQWLRPGADPAVFYINRTRDRVEGQLEFLPEEGSQNGATPC